MVGRTPEAWLPGVHGRRGGHGRGRWGRARREGGAGVKERARRGIGDVHDRGGTATGMRPEKRRGRGVRRGEAADHGGVSEDAREDSALSEERDSTGSGESVKLVVEWVTIVNACDGANDTDQRVTAGTISVLRPMVNPTSPWWLGGLR